MSKLHTRASALLRRMQFANNSQGQNSQWKLQIYEAVNGLMVKHEEAASKAQKAFNDMIRAYSLHDHVSIKNPPVDDPDLWENVVEELQQLNKTARQSLTKLLYKVNRLS